MTEVFSLAVTDLPDGTFSIPEVSLDSGVSSLRLSIQRCTSADTSIWPDTATTLDASLEVSYDNRATWIAGGAMTGLTGGIYHRRNGSEAPSSDLSCGYSTSPTDVRGSLTVSNGPLRTSVSLTSA